MVKNLSFSFSKLGMYRECPQKYKFRYVHMLPEKPKYYFAFGTALHAVMEFVLDPTRPGFPTLPEALAFFDSVWNKTSFEQKGYASLAKELEGYAEGKRIIESFYAKNESSFVHPLSVEMKSTLEMDGLSLISILDRIDYLGDGKIKILDYKTGKTVQREPDQLYMYQKVAENSPAVKKLVQTRDPGIEKIQVAQLSFYHLPSLKEMSFERAADQEIAEFWKKVLGVADLIRDGKFDPTPGETQCRFCDYRNLCPVFTGKEYLGPSGYAARPNAFPPPQHTASLSLPQDDLAHKIDRYGQLQAEMKQLEQEIIALMRKDNFFQHFGKEFKAELTLLEQWNFADKIQVVDLLRSLHLLAKVLVPTQSTIEKLLEDPAVSLEDKKKIRALGTKTEKVLLRVQKETNE